MRAAFNPCLRAWERSGEVWWRQRSWASATRQTLGFQAARRQPFSIEGGKAGRQQNAIGRWQFDHMLSIPGPNGGLQPGGGGGGGGGGEQPAVVSDALDVVPISVAPRPPRIVLIRHGESLGNRDENVYTTKADWKIGLTKLGKMQAQHAGRRLRHLVGDGHVHIYHSPYLRAVETTSEILGALDPSQVRAVREEPRISEQQFGNLRDIETIRRCKDERKMFGRFFYRFPDGEAGLDVYSRVTTFIGTLRRDNVNDDCTVVIVTHGLALRLFLMRWFQWTVEQFEATHNPPNCGIAVMTRMDADGRYRLTDATLNMIGAENAPTTSAIGRSLLRKAYTKELLSTRGGV